MYPSNFRIILVTLAVGLISVCCRAPEASGIPISSDRVSATTPTLWKSGIRIEFPELVLSVEDVNVEDFEVTVQERTALIKPRTPAGIDGSKIRVEGSQLTGMTARIRFVIGFLQYLTDDVRASPLDFSHQTGWNAVETVNNEVQIPQFYKNRENVTEVFRQLGFQNEEDFLRSLEVEYFEKVKIMSYRTQKEYFTNLLRRDRERYEQCCPEYIEQAERFLNRTPGEFRTFETLGVEVFLQELTVEIDAIDKAGRPVKFAVVGTN